ncbi:hypothetical protein P3T43_004779, partial [Paraburkholderia sp. GAS41]
RRTVAMGRRRSASPRCRLTQHAVKNGRGRTVTEKIASLRQQMRELDQVRKQLK